GAMRGQLMRPAKVEMKLIEPAVVAEEIHGAADRAAVARDLFVAQDAEGKDDAVALESLLHRASTFSKPRTMSSLSSMVFGALIQVNQISSRFSASDRGSVPLP